MSLHVDEFDFPLPEELIAQQPSASRTGSRLLHVDGYTLGHGRFSDLSELLAPGDLLVFNDTRVIKARFFGRKASGGAVEVLLERIVAARHALAQIRASKSPRPGSLLRIEDAFDVVVAGREGEFYQLIVDDSLDFWQLAERHGRLPLPPYITHGADQVDEERYQTVFARSPGAVAAPTAGLHFDEALLDRLQAKGVRRAFLTLHVGAGTFQPVRASRLDEHQMHSERFNIPAETAQAIHETRLAGGRIIAVGTTSVRALESAAAPDGRVEAGNAETAIFITPGYRFKVVDRLITNFHLPRSTLLMLVSAFAGQDVIRSAYREAVNQAYRFFSYGDAMLLEKAKEKPAEAGSAPD